MFLRSAMFPSSGTAAKSTKSIVNKFSQASWAGVLLYTGYPNGGIITATSGSMTAATLKTLLSVSGASGQMTYLSVRTADATSRTIRVKITVDGIVACDATSASISAANTGGVWTGASTSALPANLLPPIFWKSTLLIEYASSLTETDKLIVEYAYNTES